MVDRVSDIEPELLKRWGIQGIVLDLDNTIVPWHTADLSDGVAAWVARLRADGILFCLLTNNYGRQAAEVADILSMNIIKGALKPSPPAFRKALAALGTPASASVVIGDQLFTDVLGGKLTGMRAVLVRPIGRKEFPTTALLRMLEEPIVAWLRRNEGAKA
ncbi:MAG: YqeG family HAD IIIA-type phosphatase [Candidatus Eremiobacteraeota bacterium]|nr:YqeG family HAD IIIA-type phosphatase [Candidatus Eremiobacteraeota bacterium]